MSGEVTQPRPDPFPSQEFDSWAPTYDASVEVDQFPFSGYETVLEKTVAWVKPRSGLRVLDLGCGTGNLAVRLAAQGCELWCVDFSAAMLEQARQKLPEAHCLLHDIREGWPAALPNRFDRIVSAYVFHHFDPRLKIKLIRHLTRGCLVPRGALVLADISFPDAASRETVKKMLGGEWEEEYYWIAQEAIPALKRISLRVKYSQLSPYMGIYHLRNK